MLATQHNLEAFLLIPRVSIVILNWNGRGYLQQFLPSVLASTYENLEVVVADNASTDGSQDFLRSQFPGVRLITLGENYGFARGYNEALKQVRADYYVLLNSDIEVTPGWIHPIIRLMESDASVGACQPKLIQYYDRTRFEYSGACGGWIDRFGYPFARGRIFDVCETDEGQYNDVAPVFWASGAAMFVRAEIYHRMGGLDEYLFAHQEEIDLCWRMQLAGHSVYCCPESVVYHVGGGTLPKGNARKVFLNFRNNLIILAKNMRFAEAIWKIPLRFALDALSAVKSLFAGEPRYFFAVFRAHLAFVRWLILARRTNTVRCAGIRLKGLWEGSVVWAHFVKGLTRFSEIVKNKDDFFK